MWQDHGATAVELQLQEFDSVVRMTPIRRRATALIAPGEFLDGYDLISIAGTLPLIHSRFNMTPSQTGLLGASALFAAAIGLLVAGSIADRIGRRLIFVHNFRLFVILSLLAAAVTSYTELLIVRALLGVAISADIATSMTLLGEISPCQSRGGWTGAAPQIAWTLGALCSLAVAIILINLTGPVAWRRLFGLGAIPALVILIGRRTLPWSPRWLLSRGRTAGAAAAMGLFGIEPRAPTTTPCPDPS